MSVVPHHHKCLVSKGFLRYLSSFHVLFFHIRGLSQIVHVWLHITGCMHDFTFPFVLYSQFLDGLHHRLVSCLWRRKLTIFFQWCKFQHCCFRWLNSQRWAFWLHMTKLVTYVTCTYKLAPFQLERSCTNSWIIRVKCDTFQDRHICVPKNAKSIRSTCCFWGAYYSPHSDCNCR